MLICNLPCSDRRSIELNKLDVIISALGSPQYDRSCLDVFGQIFDLDHWALFRFGTEGDLFRVAAASNVRAAAAERNVNRYARQLHSVDPSLMAIRRNHWNFSGITRIAADDVSDIQYRHCFELTRVKERLSYISSFGACTYQISVYRGQSGPGFSSSEIDGFVPIAQLVLLTAAKHELFKLKISSTSGALDIASVETALTSLPVALSRREIEVCARAVAGKTIEETASDLNIEPTSVITYRSRAYQKLGISRHSELIGLVVGSELPQLQARNKEISRTDKRM